MQLSSIILISIAALSCWFGHSSAASAPNPTVGNIGTCAEYNPIRMATQKTLEWKGYKNLLRQGGGTNFAKDTYSLQQFSGYFVATVKGSPAQRNIIVVVPKKGKGDTRLYWLNKNSACRAYWQLIPSDVGAVSIIHLKD
jgi:hypothetical protein